MAGELGYVRVRSGELRQASWGTFRYVLVRLGGLRQARWGSSVLGSVRYVVFSFWLGR